MNPLFLLFGLLGAAGTMFKSSSSETTTAAGSIAIPQPMEPEEEAPQEPEQQEPVNEEPDEPEQQEPVNEEPDEPEQQEPVNEEPDEPEQQEPVNEEPDEPEQQEPVNEEPQAPEQTGEAGSDGGESPVVTIDGSVSVVAGRVATLTPADDDISDVKIVSGLQNGNVTANPDNTFAVVMTQSDFVGSQSFTYEATHNDGSTTLHQVDLNVTSNPSDHGWGTGEQQYMLATDENGDIIVEHGDNHQKVYVTNSDDALSRADIALREGLSTNQITDSWLANSDYGNSEDLALDVDAGIGLWKAVSPSGSNTSNWLLFESGYSYEGWGNNRLISWGADGEDELHPLYIGAWGEGDRPIFDQGLDGFGDSFENLVIQGIEFQSGALLLEANNVIFDDIVFTDDQLNLQGGEGITIRNSAFYDIVTTHDEARSIEGNTWETGDFTSGTFIEEIDGLLLEENLFDHNGWAADYRVDGSTEGGQPPQMFNHNIYIQDSNTDVTVRDMIVMRGSLNGLQVRSGGFIEDNVLLANNVAGNFRDDSHTLFTDNLITHAGNKQAPNIGFETAGFDANQSGMASLVDNIVAHMLDPDDPNAYAPRSDYAYRVTDPYYDDTIVWNWKNQDADRFSAQDQNVEGLDTAVLDETTIQNFTAQLLGQSTATIDDLGNYLRAQAEGELDDVVDADLIIRFFQEGFGIAPDIRPGADTLTFVPDELGDGVRWDNRLNWDTEDLPGTYSTDSVDLGGNDVVFGTNATIDTLSFGPDGTLNVYGGKLTLDGGFTGDEGGSLNVEGAGQVWTEGSDAADLDIMVQGGRFANTGDMQNANLTADGGQTILATGGAEFDLASSKTLAVFDAAAKVGFDGDNGGIALLDMHEDSTLSFAADNGDLGTIEEFRSGAFGDAPDVQSGVDLGNATLKIDLAGISASNSAFTLMDVDEIAGIFDSPEISGLGGRNAKIVVDYETDSVTLELSSGNGSVSVETIGQEDDVTSGSEALWAALTADQGVAAETAAMVPEEDDLLDAA